MLFHVNMEVRIPHGVDPEKIKQLGALEHERARELQLQRKWVHLWRVVGKFANVSVFDVDTPTELHDILNSLPVLPVHDGRSDRALPPSRGGRDD